MTLALTRAGYPHQLSLFGAPERRVYNHDAIMRERAAAIKALVLREIDGGRDIGKPYIGRDALVAQELPDAQDAALYWQHWWCRMMSNRTDSWCTLCKVRPCPVNDYLLDEARRVNAP